MTNMTRPDGSFIELIKRSGSADKNEALTAQHELALALNCLYAKEFWLAMY